MSHRGRTSGGRFTYRPDFSGLEAHYANSEMQRVKAELTTKLGKQGFYEWACTLPNEVIMDDRAYIQAIQARLVEGAQSACPQDITTQEVHP